MENLTKAVEEGNLEVLKFLLKSKILCKYELKDLFNIANEEIKNYFCDNYHRTISDNFKDFSLGEEQHKIIIENTNKNSLDLSVSYITDLICKGKADLIQDDKLLNRCKNITFDILHSNKNVVMSIIKRDLVVVNLIRWINNNFKETDTDLIELLNEKNLINSHLMNYLYCFNNIELMKVFAKYTGNMFFSITDVRIYVVDGELTILDKSTVQEFIKNPDFSENSVIYTWKKLEDAVGSNFDFIIGYGADSNTQLVKFLYEKKWLKEDFDLKLLKNNKIDIMKEIGMKFRDEWFDHITPDNKNYVKESYQESYKNSLRTFLGWKIELNYFNENINCYDKDIKFKPIQECVTEEDFLPLRLKFSYIRGKNYFDGIANFIVKNDYVFFGFYTNKTYDSKFINLKEIDPIFKEDYKFYIM